MLQLIYSSFHDVNIPYFIMGGTLLGWQRSVKYSPILRVDIGVFFWKI